jgi:hypothetical protein
MRTRVLLWVSVGLNLLLAAAILVSARKPAPQTAAAGIVPAIDEETNSSRTHVVVRRPGFRWGEVESSDFATYINNLRNIGCPEKTIRDIIVAEVNELFAERLARELNLPEQKWWLPDPDMDALQAGMDQVHALETEKNQLLTQLLGPGWEPKEIAVGGSIRFDGPVLSHLPSETRSAVERIEAGARQSRNALEARARQENRELTTEELNTLRQGTRRELAGVLNSQQLEEYLLRYSAAADQMREQLRGFGADADEFRRIFRVRDNYNQQIAAITGVDDASVARRAELERARDQAMRQTIGEERFAFYQMTQSPLFRQAQEEAEQSGAPPEKVLPIMRIKQAVADEIARIQADQTISEDQRRVALAAVQQQHQNSIERILANEPAEETAPAESAPVAQRQVEVPPFPPFPVATVQSLENTTTKGPTYPRNRTAQGEPQNANLPPLENTTTKGPTYPRNRSAQGGLPEGVELPPLENTTTKGPTYPRRR